MPGISYALADFVTGGPILDLPVMAGASWATQLNRPDALSCSVDMRDPDALALDLRSSSEPKKTVMVARTDDDVILAWGIVDDEREWDEDKQTLGLTAKGVWGSWLGNSIIGPDAARTQPLVVNGETNAALDTALYGYSLGTIGKLLVAQRLGWPGSPSLSTFILPPNEAGTRERNYLFAALKKIGPALTDLTGVENGPDFAFDAERAPDGLGLNYRMRHGSEATPRLGDDAGIWPLGGDSPISGLKVGDDVSEFATAAWSTGGKRDAAVIMSRALNDELIAAGYPPLDYVDTSHNDVTLQATLDAYNDGNAKYAALPTRSLSFNVRADASPGLGAYRPGDRVIIGVPADHPWLTDDIYVRITSISGDEAGLDVKIGCEVIR